MTQTEIAKEVFNHHIPAKKLNGIREYLKRLGRIEIEDVPTDGRSATRWKFLR
jgi:hypothetical protein